jgi:hypothetical protein
MEAKVRRLRCGPFSCRDKTYLGATVKRNVCPRIHAYVRPMVTSEAAAGSRTM